MGLPGADAKQRQGGLLEPERKNLGSWSEAKGEDFFVKERTCPRRRRSSTAQGMPIFPSGTPEG